MVRAARLGLCLLGAALTGCAGRTAAVPSAGTIVDPQTAVEELIAEDRAFARAAAATDLISGLARMFAADVIMSAPGRHAMGVKAADSVLRTNAENATSRVEWQPVCGGVSSDGRHGFTQGYMTTLRANGATVPGKYLAYWIKGANGWRVAVYKRVPRAAGNVSLAMLPPVLPQRGLPVGDATKIQQYSAGLRLAEVSFSNDATPLGLGPAFRKWGAPDWAAIAWE